MNKSAATKYVFVTGGVTSSLGKGIVSASLGKLLEARGYAVTIQKLDPYINVDPGTMNPYEHGECYVTDDGAELSLSASEATPPGQGAGAARDVRLDWRRKDGLTADLTAPRAGLADGLIGLRGGVRMTTSSGWRMDAPSVDAATDRSLIRATGGVEAEAPFGSIRADRMDLQPKREDGAGGAVLNFSGSVRLIYQP